MAAGANDPQAAQAMLADSLDRMLAGLRKEKENGASSPENIHRLINDILAPNVDFKNASRLVLGRSWKDASAEQRSRFEAAFQTFVVRFYSTALSAYAENNDVPKGIISFLPLDPKPGAKTLKLRSQVNQPNGEHIPVDYLMYAGGGSWKVVDVSVSGISMVRNYRADFESVIRASGLDSLIAKLESQTGPTPAK